jgi:uncharacterized membrane protein YdjX (TVP38/TMEM64 family)
MRGFWRPLLILAAALAVPIVPFLAFGDALEAKVTAWLDPPPVPATVALVTVGVLAADVLLPVPSSLVSTVAGARLGVLGGTLVSWLGLSIGACFGFWLARAFGRPLAARLSAPADLDEMDRLAGRYGGWILIATRALPVLAEAAVLLLGTTQWSWRYFLPAVAVSNLGIALVYSALGHFATSYGELPLALIASIVLPLAAAFLARHVLAHRAATLGVDSMAEAEPLSNEPTSS